MPRPSSTQQLPQEFALTPFRELLHRGAVHGWVSADDIREAMTATGTGMHRMKAVLRALEEAGIRVNVPTGQR